MSKIYLIRHGQTDWNLAGRIQGCQDIPLNDTGKEQAALLAERMKDCRVDLVLASPLSRAWETARGLAVGKKIPLICWKELEEIRYGSWEGMTVEEICRKYPEEYRRWWSDEGDGRPPHGESRLEALERGRRMAQRIVKLVQSHRTEGLAVVSHGALLCCMLPAFLGEETVLSEGSSIRNGSVTTLEVDWKTGKCRLEEMNKTWKG